MNWADIAIVALIAVSAVVSLVRGFVKEALSLATWVIAAWVAVAFADEFSYLLAGWISVPSARTAVAFAGLFFAVLIVGGLLNLLMGQLVSKTGLSGTDRVLGSVFGVARGVVLIGVMVLLAGLTAVPEDPWWQESQLIGHFEQLALWMKSFLPVDVAADIRYD